MMNPEHKGPHISNRHVTFLETPFQKNYMHISARIHLTKQFKALSLVFHNRHVHVHSPLLKKSHLVSNPPLTYMLKFSRLLWLMSCSIITHLQCCATHNQQTVHYMSWQIHQTGIWYTYMAHGWQTVHTNSDTNMPSGVPKGHFCVQWSIDSRNFAIHNDYCTSLHPSSTCHPRHLLLKFISWLMR